MPKMQASNILGLRGWTHVASIALQAGCKPIPVPNEIDTGIDGLVELVRNEIPSGAFLAVQAKMGPSYFRGGRPRVQADKEHFLYWSKFSMPVILVVISEIHEAYWMDVSQYLKENPHAIENGPYVLWPPASNVFGVDTLSTYSLPERVRPLDFLTIVNSIAVNDPTTRLAAISQMYALRHEPAVPYILVAQLQQEQDRHNIRAMCDFLSRYLSHPEVSFFLDDAPVATAARRLLSSISTDCLARILEAMPDDDHNHDGATIIWHISDEEIWPRSAMFERGTVQQSMAVVAGACAGAEGLKRIISDETLSLDARKSALAVFGYLCYKCSVEYLDSVAASTSDEILLALLEWMRFIILAESGVFDDDDEMPIDEPKDNDG